MSPNRNTPYPVKIHNSADLARGVNGLIAIDPSLDLIINALPEVPLRLRPAGFHGLAEIVTGQQVSKASAAAIFGRLEGLINPLTAEEFIKAGEAPLIEAGLSRAKQVTLTELAHAICNRGLDLNGLCELPVQDAMDTLTQIKGIGPWTAQVYLLFCAGHADIFPAGDIALQHAAHHILKLDGRPNVKQTEQLAKRWSPLRGIAARVLYAHYSLLKNRKELAV